MKIMVEFSILDGIPAKLSKFKLAASVSNTTSEST